MSYFLNWRDFEGANPEKFFKSTLWQGEHVMIGLNCLEPNQAQPVHAHAGADKFYFVLGGTAASQSARKLKLSKQVQWSLRLPEFHTV